MVPGLLDQVGKADVLGPLLGRVQLLLPPRLDKRPEGRRVGFRVLIWPLQVEEGVLEAVGGRHGGAHQLSCLVDRPAVDVPYHVQEAVVLVGHDHLVKVDEHQVLDAVDVPVQAVVESGEQALCSDLLLRVQVEPPLEERHLLLADVVPQHAVHLGVDRVVVQGEPAHAEELVQLEEL